MSWLLARGQDSSGTMGVGRCRSFVMTWWLGSKRERSITREVENASLWAEMQTLAWGPFCCALLAW